VNNGQVTLTAADYQNILGFMDRADLKGIAEAQTLALLAFKLNTLLNPPVIPPTPLGKNRATQTDKDNVIELFPEQKEGMNG
jgi:hypothetical protein